MFSIIQQGEIKKFDYLNLGLFEDKQLKVILILQKISKKIDENSDLFELVSSIHDRGNIDEDVEENLETMHHLKIKKNNWYEAEFEAVRKVKRMWINKKVKIEFNDEEFQNQFEDLEVWNKIQVLLKLNLEKKI